MHVYAKDGDYVTPKLNFLNLFMTKKYSDIIMNRKTKENCMLIQLSILNFIKTASSLPNYI